MLRKQERRGRRLHDRLCDRLRLTILDDGRLRRGNGNDRLRLDDRLRLRDDALSHRRWHRCR